MSDYKNGKIYKIVCYETGEVYIGSTINSLEYRLDSHKHHANTCCSKQIIDRGNYYIELLETYPSESKYELLRKEGEYQKSIECINIHIAGRTQKEWYELNKVMVHKKQKQYRENNKEELTKYSRNYYYNNRESVKETCNQYRLENAEAIKARKNKVVICECGMKSANNHLARHRRTKRHIDLMANI